MNTNKQVIDEWSGYSEDEIEKFGDEGDFSRQYLLTPTIFDLLGDVKGKKILDAGSGTGYLARKLAKVGAEVTATEPAQQMYNYCIKREEEEKLGINYLQKDLSELEEFENEFDVIVSNMVLMDIPNYQTAIKNCIKSLKPGGVFIFSISHPAFSESDSEWQKSRFVKITNYFDPEPRKERYGFTFFRSISEYINFVIANGCKLEKIVEPRLAREVLDQFPEADRNYKVPQFLFFKFIKE